MSAELATIDHSESIALSSEQTYWTQSQVAALRHIGVENASEGDLTVFHHVCQRTGLDPFARQIYMIGRESSEPDGRGGWHKVTKQTIQTGIDGFRLIGRRAADRAHHSVSVSAPEWAADDGSWRPVWMKNWGTPIAARVTIRRNGEPFEAVALFEEYAQTKRNGDLTRMWAQRPAGQVAKCAEALAWRMAFPQDLSGIYSDDEMGQADNAPVTVEQEQPRGLAAALQTSGPDESVGTTPVDASGPENDPGEQITKAQLTKLHAVLTNLGMGDEAHRDEALAFYASVIGHPVASSKELTKREAGDVIDALEDREAQPFADEPVDAEVVSE